MSTFSFAPPISSFRVDNSWTSTARRSEEEARSSLSFSNLYPIRSSRSETYVLSVTGTWVVIVAPDGTRVVLLSNLGDGLF